MMKVACVATVVAALILAAATPASAQTPGVGHRVENLVVTGSFAGEQRKVKVHLWYPAAAAAYATATPTVYTSALNGRVLDPNRWDPLKWTVNAQIARETSAIEPGGKPFPVILFSHGAVNDPFDYAWTLELIARAGYIVVAPAHTNNTQDDVRIDYINGLGLQPPIPCDDGRPSPCSRNDTGDNSYSIRDRARDVTAVLDAVPGWFGARADMQKVGVMGHSRGTITALGSAGGSTRWGFGPDPRVKAIMGMAIGARAIRDGINLADIKVPTLLVAGQKDTNTVPAISMEAIAAIGSADKTYQEIPNGTHRTFDSTYCAQLTSAASFANGNPRAVLDQYSVPLIGASGPGGISGKASFYCASSYFTPAVDTLLRTTPNAEYPPALSTICIQTTPPCTSVDSEAVRDLISARAIEFFGSKLARIATGDVGGTVPATLALTLGLPATFGAFTPGVMKDYTATTTANVISTAADAALSVSDPGHLSNGPFSLPQPLVVQFSKSSWSAPVSNDGVTITFKQHIDATDPLRTGTYSRTLTFTLSTTTP